MALTIGVDIGGTKVAAGVVDEDGQIVDASAPAHPGRRTRSRSPSTIGRRDPGARLTDGRSRPSASARPGSSTRPGRSSASPPTSPGVRSRCRRRSPSWSACPSWWRTTPTRWPGARPGSAPGAARPTSCASRSAPASAAASCSTARSIEGRWGMGAELGHMQMVPEGRPCGCGNLGCWEQYASGSALVDEAREIAAARAGAGRHAAGDRRWHARPDRGPGGHRGRPGRATRPPWPRSPPSPSGSARAWPTSPRSSTRAASSSAAASPAPPTSGSTRPARPSPPV